MKHYRFISALYLLLLLSHSINASQTFRFSVSNEWLKNTGGFHIKINGKSIPSDTSFIFLLTHYPQFDTVSYYSNTDNSATHDIITRFHPGKHYEMVMGKRMFEIFEKRNADIYNKAFREQNQKNANFDSIRSSLYESAQVSFLVLKHQTKDTLLGLYGDWGGIAYAYYLQNAWRSPTDMAFNGFFSSNIFNLMIASPVPEKSGKLIINHNGIIEDIEQNDLEFLVYIQTRFFHNEKLLLEYDAASKTYSLHLLE